MLPPLQKLQWAGFLLILPLILQLSCSSPTDPPIEEIIPTTEAVGPGGPAYLYGFIKDFVHPSNSVTNTRIYIMNQQDYSDTLLRVFVNSTDASFKITEMPEGVYDLIFMNDNYLCAKIGKLLFNPNGNTFNNPNSSGYFIDSTIYIANIADSVGRPDAPPFGLQGYGLGITVYLKSETADSIGWQIVQNSGCDTLRVDRYDDPVFLRAVQLQVSFVSAGSSAGQFHQRLGDAGAGAAVPQLRHAATLPVPRQRPLQQRADRIRVGAGEFVGADLDRLGPLGRIAQGDAGDAEDRRLLSEAARVGDDRSSVPHQVDELQVRLRRNDVVPRRQVGDATHRLGRARMDGEHHAGTMRADVDRLQ